ncbi:uncharacterized protein LOC134216460 [Armigeres subalbatus]|uniref:uncharacterized protein LOC134216460 n=1 Tax=Armigeres subalbatus TaxID=124917 RepID=UPI002ED519CC
MEPQSLITTTEQKPLIEKSVPTETKVEGNTDVKQQLSFKRSLNDNDVEEVEMGPQKKLCRFYFLDNCSRAECCSFMHSEFPCKFYYFGYECKDGNSCKLRHGAALDDIMKQALWDHVTSGPANLLQRFPCFPSIMLKKHFDERHHELELMEQEGLLDQNTPPKETDEVLNRPSSTLLKVIENESQTQLAGGTLTQLSELADILQPDQVASLTAIGIDTLEKLFKLGASAFLGLGFDFDTLIKIGNFKESRRRGSIYNSEESHVSNDVNDSDLFGSEELDGLLDSVATDQPALTDQELLNILNEEPNGLSESIGSNVSKQDCDGFVTADDNVDNYNNGISHAVPQNVECSLKAFRSDLGNECLQLMLYPSGKEKENDKQSLDSIQRTVDQLKKIDSLLSEPKEQDVSWGSAESDTSADHSKHDSSVTDSINQSFGSDSDSQTCFRMPFKSIINQYTPAKEIDASNKKYRIANYHLIPIDIPRPSFDRIRRSFVMQPTFSLDPRIQIMFNVGPSEVRHGNHPKVCDRDPRLKKHIEPEPHMQTV